MTISELIAQVDRSSQNETSANYGEFCAELGVVDDTDWRDEFNKRVKGHHLSKWCCTDSWVGLVVYFLDDTPVAVSSQFYRKSDRDYHFVSHAAAGLVRDFILTLLDPYEPQYQLLEHDQELGDGFSVQFEGELISRDGSYRGRSCRALPLDRKKDPHGPSQAVDVVFDDGSSQQIPLAEFILPFCLKAPGADASLS